jgi:lipoprotein NlpD
VRAASWIWTALLVAGSLGGCAGERADEIEIYVVQPRDTVYSIAWRHNLDYHDLAKWNRLGADYRISVGQRLRLGPAGPDAQGSVAPGAATGTAATGSATGAATGAGAATASAAPLSSPGARELPRGRSSATANRQALAGVVVPHLAWVWPTDRTASPRPVQSGGVLFTGRLGQEVRAAAAGRVVYTGSGIRGYGQLVIVKHDDVLLSAYAYNREVLVSDGQAVAAGQPIARMGPGANQTPTLYFEIRVNGKSIDPLPFLNGKR